MSSTTNNSKIIEEVVRKNSLASSLTVTRYTSGIVHDSYDLGNYVLKIEGEADFATGVLKYQPEILEKLLSIGTKVPKVFDSGIVDGKQYLLMEKVRGTNIVHGWMKFDMRQKENFIAQLAEELKKYHSLKFPQYSIPICSGKSFSSLDAAFKDGALKGLIDFSQIRMDDLSIQQRKDLAYLKNFYDEHISTLKEENTAVLVHNDIHLENIFYENEQLTGIIDFDWASYAPKDYELRHMVETFRYPLYTVEERLEPLYENYQMIEEFGFLKKYYPDLFKQNNLATRIRLFYLRKIIGRIEDYQQRIWKGKNIKALEIFSEEMRDIYRTDWLGRLLE